MSKREFGDVPKYNYAAPYLSEPMANKLGGIENPSPGNLYDENDDSENDSDNGNDDDDL